MRQRYSTKGLIILLLVGLVLGQAAIALGSSSKQQDSLKCDTLNEKEARSILDSLRLNEAKILKIQASPIQGLWEVAVENQGARFLVYVDCSKRFVMPGPIIEYRNGIDRTRQRVEELNRDKRVNLASLPLNEALIMGNQNAPTKVIVFLDPDCSFCKKLHQEMKKLLEKRSDIVFLLKLAPIHKNPDLEAKSKAIVCSKSLKALDEAFEGAKIPTVECQTKELEENAKFMETNGLNGVPFVLFPDGSIQTGFVEASVLEKRIDEALANMKSSNAKKKTEEMKKR